MKIHFYVHYATRPGQRLSISIGPASAEAKTRSLEYLNEELWHLALDLPAAPETLHWQYHFYDEKGGPGGTPLQKTDWETERSLDLRGIPATETLQITDYWNPAGAPENAFFTQPFRDILLRSEVPPAPPKNPGGLFTHIFRVKAPLLGPHEAVCLLGHGTMLRAWDTSAPLVLAPVPGGGWWEIRLNLSREDFPLAYKYGVWDTAQNRFRGFEQGNNRTLYDNPGPGKTQLHHDGFVRMPNQTWRGAGVAIPVFSLRTEQSFGVGEFTDLPALADWAKSTGLKLIQLLPVNDTTATHSWVDSYPYSAVSAFALHPIYLNLAAVAGKKHAALLKPFSEKQTELNALEAVDYEEVLQVKHQAVRQLFDVLKDEWAADPAWKKYFSENRHWLVPYAAFCHLRDQNRTADFKNWPAHATFEAAEIEKLLSPEANPRKIRAAKNPGVSQSPKSAEAVNPDSPLGLHLFIQWHLHLQLRAAVEHAHGLGIALKGDIPIGISPQSADAWVAPELYNMDQQAGAPPDDFAEKGQNWGFPTYNWARMKADGFAWWRQRFDQMSLYFDAFRIDHILGFFRIWSSPMHAVDGILGRFVPALPVRGEELSGTGLGPDRLCRPFINDEILQQTFGADTDIVKTLFLEKRMDGRYDLKSEFATQRQVEALGENGFQKLAGLDDAQFTAALRARVDSMKTGLKNLIANVLLFEVPGSGGQEFHFRIAIDKTSSFQNLDARQRHLLKNLHDDYFYRRQDDLWQIEAMDKLPALKCSTNMLICGEDLGMVPGCVPEVMEELGILSLEIQRMPKASGQTFFDPKDAPYLSVVTPATHDMSTLRGWWEEDRNLSQRFYKEQLGRRGDAPWFCEPDINAAILEQHFQSPAMWAIFQIQDLLGMDGTLRRENPADERINVPAIKQHYWRYRMHLSMADLMNAEGFNARLRGMVAASGRG